MTVYMLGFVGGALGSERHSACTYLGYCDDGRLDERIAEHRAGRGAAITRAAVQKGFTLELVASMSGDRKLERWLKNKKNSRAALAWMQKQLILCPGCRREVIHVREGECWYCAIDHQFEPEAADVGSKEESDRVATV
jgi:predicted GIY-YIG superfamily endonuclease